MRIAIAYYHDLRGKHAGGILQYIRGVMKYSPGDCEFAFWCRENEGDRSEEVPPRTEVRSFTGPRGAIPLPETMRLLWHVWKRKRAIEESGDVLYLHTSEFTIPWLFGRGTKPIVLTIHGGQQNAASYQRLGQRLMLWISDRVAARVATRIVMVSQESRDYYRTLFPRFAEKYEYLPTFADDGMIPSESRADARRELGLPVDAKVVSFIGRLHPQKRVDDILRVFAQVRQKIPNAVLCIAGSGPLEESLKAERDRLGLTQESARFLGVIDRRQVGLLFRASDASMLLTNWEGTPMSLLESLAVGTPAVASDVADHKRILENGKSGFVVANGRWDEAVAGTIKTLEDGQRMSREAAEAGKRYLASSVVPRIVEVLKDTAKNSK